MISVVVVSFNTRDLLRACLASLRRFEPAAELVVVDNASRDGSADMVRAEFPGVKLVEAGANLGFAGANNAGLRLGGRRPVGRAAAGRVGAGGRARSFGAARRRGERRRPGRRPAGRPVRVVLLGKHRWFRRNRPWWEAAALVLLDVCDVPRKFLRGLRRPARRRAEWSHARVSLRVLTLGLLGRKPTRP